MLVAEKSTNTFGDLPDCLALNDYWHRGGVIFLWPGVAYKLYKETPSC